MKTFNLKSIFALLFLGALIYGCGSDSDGNNANVRTNPTNNFCSANPTAPSCMGGNYCMTNPYAPECQFGGFGQTCATNPNMPGCLGYGGGQIGWTDTAQFRNIFQQAIDNYTTSFAIPVPGDAFALLKPKTSSWWIFDFQNPYEYNIVLDVEFNQAIFDSTGNLESALSYGSGQITSLSSALNKLESDLFGAGVYLQEVRVHSGLQALTNGRYAGNYYVARIQKNGRIYEIYVSTETPAYANPLMVIDFYNATNSMQGVFY